jgi:hypothetical protein
LNCIKNILSYQPLLSNKLGLKILILLLLNLSNESYDLFRNTVIYESSINNKKSTLTEDKIFSKDINNFSRAVLQGVIVKTDEIKNMIEIQLKHKQKAIKDLRSQKN